MSFVPNLRTKRPDQEYVQSKIDVLVNYLDVLNAAETAGGLVTGIPNPSSFKVAVVGTGPAGVVAAYELLRLGVNVDIYSSDQASYRYGRAFSYPFPGNEQLPGRDGCHAVPALGGRAVLLPEEVRHRLQRQVPGPGQGRHTAVCERQVLHMAGRRVGAVAVRHGDRRTQGPDDRGHPLRPKAAGSAHNHGSRHDRRRLRLCPLGMAGLDHPFRTPVLRCRSQRPLPTEPVPAGRYQVDRRRHGDLRDDRGRERRLRIPLLGPVP